MMRRLILRLALLSAAFAPSAHAAIAREFYRSSEALAMGNAMIALTEDENAVFYNPAGVAAYRSMTLHLLDLDLATSTDTIGTKDSLKGLRSPDPAALNRLMGKNLYAQATGTSFLLLPNLGFAAFYDYQGALTAVNQAFPKIEFGYQRTSGFQLAWGMSLGEGRHQKVGRGKKDAKTMTDTRIGFAVKYITRLGGYKTIPISELVSYTSSSDILNLMGQTGSGYGVDFGFQRVQKLSDRFSLRVASAWTNFGDISVGNGSDPAKSILAAGAAGEYDLTIGKFALEYDLRNLNRGDDIRKKQHLGARFAFPFLLDLYGGIDQAYFTYGAGVDLALVKVSAVSYAEESGSLPYQDPERRYQVSVDVKFPL